MTLDITKASVYEEVARTTSYTGAKMGDEDGNAYDRIFTTDEDREQLERFWGECCVEFCEVMKRYLTGDTETGRKEPGELVNPGSITIMPGGGDSDVPILTEPGHRFRLEFSRSFDAALLPSMKRELFSYFVMGITAKWYVFTNKAEAGDYAAASATLLEGIHRKACYKMKPQRPSY